MLDWKITYINSWPYDTLMKISIKVSMGPVKQNDWKKGKQETGKIIV